MMLSLNSRRMISGAAGLALIALASCAPVGLRAIPDPPPTARLRVYVQALTAPGKWHWGTPHDVFVANQIRRVERYLEETGIYEVVSQEDVRQVLGDRTPSRADLARNDWDLGRAAGRALHADYVMVIERSRERSAAGAVDWFFTSTLINTISGKEYQGRVSVPRVTGADMREQAELIKRTYRDIFMSAKDEMLAKALTKGHAVPEAGPAAVPAPVPPPAPQIRQAQEPVPAAQAGEDEKEDVDTPAAWESALQPLIAPQGKGTAGVKLVVYDFDAPERYRPAAQILTEALREELFRLKRFELVNRETLQKVLEEIALQQTGLIDEKEAVRTGRGLAANQVITGRLGTLGKVFLFQAKRTDVETFATLGVTSAKFIEGEEEEILDRLPGLARALAGQD